MHDLSLDPPLGGYVVIDLSSGIAGGYCTKLLAEGGAEVIKVEPPQGDSLRRWSASGATIPPGEDGALFVFLACSKFSVVADPGLGGDLAFVHELLASADAVVWSRGSVLAEHPSLTPAEIRRVHPHLTVTAITPFGLEGPWSSYPATEFTAQAWSGGMIGMGRGAPDRAPIFVAGQIGEWLAGAFGAAATLSARMSTLSTGAGSLIDLSMLETQILCLTYYSVSFFEALGRPWRDRRRLISHGVMIASDGLVVLGIGTAQHWFDLCAMIGHEEWIDETSAPNITEQAELRAPVIQEWFRTHTVAEIRELASAYRIPNGPVANGAELPTLDHFIQRGSFHNNPRDGFQQPGPAYRLTPARLRTPEAAPRLGAHTSHYRHSRRTPRPAVPVKSDQIVLPFKGVRVLDMTSVWAGPSCAHFLALLGADVIHVESPGRPDATRMLAGVSTAEDQWWEKSPIFSGLNTNKRSVAIDIRDQRGRDILHRLAATCDVVIENYTPRVLEHIGLDFAGLQALRPDAILVRMPGFGLDGPWRDNPALAVVIEGVSGLSWLTGYPDQKPAEPFTVGDANAGIHAVVGLFLALEHRRRTGQGVMVEAPMVDAALSVAAEQVIEFSRYGALLARDGNRGPAAAPQDLFQTNEIDEFGRADCWVAVAVVTDEQWSALVVAIGEPDWSLDPLLATVGGRRDHQSLISAHLAEWCLARSGDEIVQRLWEAGVPVGKVMWPHRLAELSQLASRKFFENVGHPVNRTAKHSTVPMRLTPGPDQFHVRPAPLLGEHNREVLAELGLAESEIVALEAEGVIGTAPNSWRAHQSGNRAR